MKKKELKKIATKKQRKCIKFIKNTCNVKFKGKTSQDVYDFIGKWLPKAYKIKTTSFSSTYASTFSSNHITHESDYIENMFQDYFDRLGMYDDEEPVEYDYTSFLEEKQRPDYPGAVDWRYEKGGVYYRDYESRY